MSKVQTKAIKSKKVESNAEAFRNIPIISADGLFLSALHPKYLHTNSTSHTWPFSAVAELIDNAYDPDVNASQLFIDLKTLKGQQTLVFTDNGNGMMPKKLYKMLGFGFCEKVAVNDHLPVGHYGNGFKSGSMRLGKDALVFTKTETRWSLGFLSQTYLENIGSDTIVVPIVTWDPKKFTFIEGDNGSKSSLAAILEHSVLNSVNDLKEEFRAIKGTTGTRIIISNLRRHSSGSKSELDFTSDASDIRIPDDLVDSDESKYSREQRQDHIPASDYSLRAYCSILYLKPRMQIILRGRKVKTTVVAKSLAKTEVDVYRPYTPSGYGKPVKIVFGFSQNKNHYGIMMYHRNRLIKPYVRVGYQLKPNSLGVGVIGVIECDFLQPTHNKQDFDYTKAFRACMAGLGRKLNEYWQEKKTPRNRAQTPVIEETEQLLPDQNWVQCDNPDCLKWRMLPDSVNLDSLPEKWYCKDHPLPEWRSCDIAEQLEAEPEQIKPYKKEVKKQLEKEKQKKKQVSQDNERKAKELIDIVEKNKVELEAEKKKRLENEQKAKKQEAEIQRLTMQLQKSSSVPANLNAVNNASPGQQPKDRASSALLKQTPVQSVSGTNSPSRPVPGTNSPSRPVSGTNSPSRPNSKSASKPAIVSPAHAVVPKSLVAVTPVAVPVKVSPYPTRQSINQAMKVRLPSIARKNFQVISTPQVTAAQGSPQNPIVLGKQTPTVNKIPSIAVSTAVSTVKSFPSILPQKIIVSPKQLQQSLTQVASIQSTQSGMQKVITVLRFTDPSKVPVTASGPQTVSTVAANNNVTVRPCLPAASSVPYKISMAAPSKISPVPSSDNISHQLAQIGIDVIAAQVGQDIKAEPVTTPVNQPKTSESQSPVVVNNSSTPSTSSEHREKRNNNNIAPKRSNDDPDIIDITPKKRTRSETKSKDAPTSQLSALNGETTKSDMKQEAGDSGKSHSSEVSSNHAEFPAGILKTTDKDVIENIKTLPSDRVLATLAQRSQQLRELRQSVCQLLAVLVPDLNLPDSKHKSLDDDTIDSLLKDVLNANTGGT